MIHPATCFLRGLFTCTGVNLIRNTATRGLSITFLYFYFEDEIRKARDVNRQSYIEPNRVSVFSSFFFIFPKIDR